MYKEVYRIGGKIPKRDKLGIHATLETLCLAMMACAIEAMFLPRPAKKSILEKLRLKTEVAKQLVRTEMELSIISDDSYIKLGKELVEISKMVTKWLQSLSPKPEKERGGSFS